MKEKMLFFAIKVLVYIIAPIFVLSLSFFLLGLLFSFSMPEVNLVDWLKNSITYASIIVGILAIIFYLDSKIKDPRYWVKKLY